MADVSQLVALIEPVARILLGEPNRALSSKLELRYGSRGSLSVDLKKATWFDHEIGEGGGLLDLITRQTGLLEDARFEWLEQNTNYKPEPRSNGGNSGNGAAQPSAKPKLGPIVETFDYADEGANFLFQVTKHNPKDYRQRRHATASDKPEDIHDGCYVWGVKGVRHDVPYRLPELIEAVAIGHLILIVEGEKDANNSWRIGIPATCNAGGAGKWRKELNAHLKGADVVIIPDNDLPGHQHARKVAEQLRGVAGRIRILDLKLADWPDMPLKADLSDWLEHGGTAERLYELIEQLPDWSPQDAPTTPSGPVIRSRSQFIAGFIPPHYLADGIVQHRFIYSMTGKTGDAKTAVALLIATLVASSEQNAYLANHRVDKGRVIYFVGENPDDVRMRVIGMDYERTKLGEDPTRDNLWFIPGIFEIDDMIKVIEADVKTNGEVSLIVVDTSAAYFLGNEELSNTQMGGYARKLRKLTSLPGGPCVLVLCHPIKHATEQSHLLPRGGGAYLAEMDGNLTLWRRADEVVELSTFGKFRGPDFRPLCFKLERIKDAPRLKDAKGRQISTVHAVAMSQQEAEGETARAGGEQDQVLAAMLAKPDGTLREWAEAIGWYYGDGNAHHKKVERILTKELAGEKPRLVHQERDGHWLLTEAGKEEARKAAIKKFHRDHPLTP